MFRPSHVAQLVAGAAFAASLVAIVGCGGGGDSSFVVDPLVTALTGTFRTTAIQQNANAVNNPCPTILVISATDTESCTNSDFLTFAANGTFSHTTNTKLDASGTWTAAGSTLTLVTNNQNVAYTVGGNLPNLSFTQISSTSATQSQSNGVIFFQTKQ